jgi:hypothetical protein
MGLDGVVYEKDFGPAADKCVSGIADSTSKSWIVNSTVFVLLSRCTLYLSATRSRIPEFEGRVIVTMKAITHLLAERFPIDCLFSAFISNVFEPGLKPVGLLPSIAQKEGR